MKKPAISAPQVFGIDALRDEIADAFDDEGFVFLVRDAKPRVGAFQHVDVRLFFADELVNGFRDERFGFFFAAVRAKELVKNSAAVAEDRRRAPQVTPVRLEAG